MSEDSIFSFPAVTEADVPTETPDVDTDVSDEPLSQDTDTDVPSEDDSPETQPETEEKGVSAPKAPISETRKSLKELVAAHPEAAAAIKAASDALGRAEAIDKLFPRRMVDGQQVGGITEAQLYKTAIDNAGGLPEIAKLQSIVTDVEETDALLAEGNPELLKRIAKDSPEGMVKLAPAYLKEVYQIASAQARAGDASALDTLTEAIQPHAISLLRSSGFERVLNALANVRSLDEVRAIHDNMRQWYDGESARALQAGQQDTDPRAEALSKREQEFNRKLETAFNSQVKSAVSQHVNKELGTRLAPYLKSHPELTRQQQADIANSLYTELDGELNANPNHMLQYNSYAKKQDQDRAIKHQNDFVSSVADRVVSKVVKAYGLTAKKTISTRQNTQPATPAGQIKPIQVTDRPDRSTWDIDRMDQGYSGMDYDSMVIRGYAFLKNGRLVKWK